MFNHWRSALVRVEELKQRQADYVVRKNKELVRHLLGEWRQKLQSSLVARSFTHKLLLTILHAWHVHAKGLARLCFLGGGGGGCCCVCSGVCFALCCVFLSFLFSL